MAVVRPTRGGCGYFWRKRQSPFLTEQVDLGNLQQRSEAYTAINPLQRVPALVLDDGTVITESVAICRYFEALQPDPPLFGRDAVASALIEMWNRRVEFHLYMPVSAVFQHLHPAMKAMVDPQVSAWGEANKPRIFDFLRLLDGELQEPAVCRRSAVHDRRHHRAGGGGFHESVEADRSRGICRSAPLARTRFGASKRIGVVCTFLRKVDARVLQRENSLRPGPGVCGSNSCRLRSVVSGVQDARLTKVASPADFGLGGEKHIG